jgi:PAS domain S-box-containing protein
VDTTLNSVLLLISAACCLALGILVLTHNHRKLVHWAFAALAANLMLWALGVFAIINAEGEPHVRFWIRTTFIIACFFPITFYQFIGLFPRGMFTGSRRYLVFHYVAVPALIALSFTSLHVRDVQFTSDGVPIVSHGPVFLIYFGMCLVMFVVMHLNLFRKLRHASGVEQRQIHYVLLGIFGSIFLGTFTNIVLPAFQINELQPYGPTFLVLMMGTFAFAMVRYHLMDIRVIVSRTTVYIAVTAFVIVTFITMAYLVQWAFNERGNEIQVLPTILAALIVAMVVEAVKERIELVFARVVLKERYDANRLFARINEQASQVIELDQLLKIVADDIQTTIGVGLVRLFLVDDRRPNLTSLAYSSAPDEVLGTVYNQAPLLDYAEAHTGPIVLEDLLHVRPNEHKARMAMHMAEMDAHLCLPLRSISGIVGLLMLGRKDSLEMYSSEDLVVFRALAGPLGTAVENARLYNKLGDLNLHLTEVLGRMREGVIAVDAEGKVTTVNTSAQALLGPVVLGQSLESLTPEVAQILRITLRDQRGVRDFETRVPRPQGEPTPVLLSSSCLESRDPERRGAMAMIYDLAQIKRLEENVQRADRLSSIGTMAAGMAHEIKNPLVSIKTFTQLLPSRYNDDDFRSTFSAVVPVEVERINTIVSRLLDFARSKPVRFESQNLRCIIEGVLTLVENETRKEHITVETEWPDRPVEVYGDEHQLHQLFLNLILNGIEALRATEGGVLRIEARHDSMHMQRAGQATLFDAECVRMSITDTGCGIDPENMKNLFNPFYTTKVEGSGLGLAVVHGIVTEHGGEIEVCSAPGDTTFSVTLPLASTMAAVTEAR